MTGVQTCALPISPSRPVDPNRANITVQKLAERGSEIVEGTQEAKKGIIGAGIATAASAAGQIKEASSQVSDIAEGLKSGAGIWEIVKDYWYVFVIFFLVIVCCFLLWRAYKGADKAETSRVKSARNGTNVRV